MATTSKAEAGTPSRLTTSTRPHTSTHASAIQSSAFFRPMSSQRLQAQRGHNVNFRDAVVTSGRRLSNGTVSTYDHHEAPSSVPTYADTTRAPSHRTRLSESTRVSDQPTNTTHGGTVRRDRSESSAPLNINPPEPTQPKLDSVVSSPVVPKEDSIRHASTQRYEGKNYQFFSDSNMVFFFGGRLLNTKAKPISVATFVLIVVPWALFFGFSAPWLWREVSPAIPIVFAWLGVLCISSFLHASFTDPGILPRNQHTSPTYDQSSSYDPQSHSNPEITWSVIGGRELGKAMEVPTKYCKSCKIWRPPRAHHCRICDVCIDTVDHHCLWLNTCVGRRNYHYFFTFVSSGFLLGFYLLGACLAHILIWRSRNGTTFADAISEWRVPFALVLYGALASPYPLLLALYHIWLISKGQTTREYLSSEKLPKNSRHRPYSRGGLFANVKSVLLRPRSPSYMVFWGRHEVGDQRFAPEKGTRKSTKSPGGEDLELKPLS